MNSVMCQLVNGAVRIYKNGKLVGWVKSGKDNDPEMTLFSDTTGVIVLTFADIAIVQDNWNQMKMMEAEEIWKYQHGALGGIKGENDEGYDGCMGGIKDLG